MTEPTSNLSLPSHPSECGPCDDCRAALADYATIPAYQKRLAAQPEQIRAEIAYWRTWPEPDPERLGRHATRYGLDGFYTNSTAGRGKQGIRLW